MYIIIEFLKDINIYRMKIDNIERKQNSVSINKTTKIIMKTRRDAMTVLNVVNDVFEIYSIVPKKGDIEIVEGHWFYIQSANLNGEDRVDLKFDI